MAILRELICDLFCTHFWIIFPVLLAFNLLSHTHTHKILKFFDYQKNKK